ncbi:MAG: hypothetical protein P1U53_15920, partial [Sulfitobacter sp.]|nr:hypothetical protein [Sulfitobacter sp.]
EPNGEAAPLALNLQGTVQGLFKDAHLDLRTTPFAPSPSMEIDFAADGLQGRKLTPWLPAFLGDVQCSDLHGGRIAGHLGLDLELPESDRPWSAAIDHGFGAYLTVEDFKLLENPISAPLMAFDLMQVKAPKVHRTHGQVERIEVTGPNLRTWQDGQGLHMGGLLWKRSPRWGAMLADAWTVDTLQLKRLQWDHQDRTVEPMWHMPIREGLVQAFDLATHFQDGDPPMRVSASLRGGEVSLPLREPDTLEALRQMEAEGPSAPSGPRAMESRRAFERLEIQGRLSGWTEPEASLQVEGTAFELAGLAGLAKRHGLALQDGLLDQTHVFRIQPGSGFTWNATHRTDLLNVQESRPGSFITARNWPCDLPTFLQGLRVEEGGQRLAMQMQLPATWPARSEWTGALNASFQRAAEASHAKAQELAQAQATSSATTEGNSLQIEFEPASARLTPQAKAELTRWSSKLGRGSRPALRLSHTFGLEDLNRAQILGTPPTGTLQALLSKLRQRKAQLARDRQSLKTSVSNSMPSGTASRWGPMREELARLDQLQIANEEALDRVLNLLTPGSERRQNRRTRSAALSLAQLRQDTVVRFLKDRGWPISTSPIHTRPPQFTHRNPGQGGRILIRAGR